MKVPLQARKSLLALLFPTLILFCLWTVEARAATVNAASCSQTAVQAAVNSANAGDTVIVPTGTCTWAGNVSINKSLTIQGAGMDVTTLIGGSIFKFASDVDNIRVTGFTFDGNWASTSYQIETAADAVGNQNFRIDHSKFKNRPYATGGSAISVWGFSYGVIDHDQFIDACGETIQFNADQNAAFVRTPVVGGYTNGTLFIEDNQFTATSNGIGAGRCGTANANWENIFDGGSGARVVIRHNTITSHPQLRWQKVIEAHGFEANYSWPTGHANGIGSVEIYDNTLINNNTDLSNLVKLRGGTGIIYNNTIRQGPSCPSSCQLSGGAILLTNYRSYVTPQGSESKTAINQEGYTDRCHSRAADETTLICEGCGGVYGACREQVNNLYIHGNVDETRSPQWQDAYPYIEVDSTGYTPQDIVLGANYFGAQMPGYIPYSYPHPLVSGGTPPPAPPKNLRIR